MSWRDTQRRQTGVWLQRFRDYIIQEVEFELILKEWAISLLVS